MQIGVSASESAEGWEDVGWMCADSVNCGVGLINMIQMIVLIRIKRLKVVDGVVGKGTVWVTNVLSVMLE